MIIGPVFAKNSNQFVWKISDFKLPNNIDDIIDSNNWKHYNQYAGSTHRYSSHIPEMNSYMETASTEIENMIRTQTHYNYQWTWPYYFVNKCRLRANDSTLYIKDTPGFNMGIHLDNMLVFGTLIINLRDCENSRTVYYKDKTSNEITYEGPVERGTGVFHLNSPQLYHTGLNRGNDDRYIAMLNYINHGMDFDFVPTFN